MTWKVLTSVNPADLEAVLNNHAVQGWTVFAVLNSGQFSRFAVIFCRSE